MDCQDTIRNKWESRQEDLDALFAGKATKDWLEDNGHGTTGDDLFCAQNEYGLHFEYKDPRGSTAGYWCYLLSTGGPQEEIRFFASPNYNGQLQLTSATFVLYDWGDTAELELDTLGYRLTAERVWDHVAECAVYPCNLTHLSG